MSGNKRRGLAPQFMKGKDAEKEIEIKTNEMGNRVPNVYIFTISRIIIFHSVQQQQLNGTTNSIEIVEEENNIDRVKCHN